MARHGVTYKDVSEAATHLSGQGKNPTIEQIRHTLGTGSSTTIAAHLKAWKEQQNGQVTAITKANIPQELLEMVKGLWERMHDITSQQMTTKIDSLEKAITELQQELHKYKTNNQRWQQLFNQWQQEKEKLTTEKLTLDGIITSLNEDKISLETKLDGYSIQIQEKQQRIDELHRLHEEAKRHWDERSRVESEERKKEKKALDDYRLLKDKELFDVMERLNSSQEQIAKLKQQTDTLQEKNKLLNQTNTTTLTQLEKANSFLLETERSKIKYQQACEQWEAQYHLAQSKIDAHLNRVIDAEVKIKDLTSQLQQTKSTLNNANDKLRKTNKKEKINMDEVLI